MAQSLLFLNEPQTVTQWKGVGHDPVSAAECLFIDELTGDIVVTSLVAANAAKNRVSYSQARFYASEGGNGAATTQFSGESASSSSVVTTPSRQITSVTIGCRSGPSRPILAARRFPRPIMIRSNALNANNSTRDSNAAPTSASPTSSSTAAANNNGGNAQYEPAYLVAVSIDTKTIRLYTSAPYQPPPSAANSNTNSASDVRSPPPPQQQQDTQLYFTIGLGSYTCYPNSIRFRADYYHIRHFYWASNAVKHEHARSVGVSGAANNATNTASNGGSDDAALALSSSLDPNENASRSFYLRSKLLLGGGGMMVPAPPESADASIRRTVGSVFSSYNGLGGSPTVRSPNTPSGGFPASEGSVSASFNEVIERQSGISVTQQVSRLHASLQRDHLMVVFTEISVDLVLVDFKSSPSAGGDKSSSSAPNAGKGNSGGGSSSKSGVGSSGLDVDGASRSGCDGMLVVLRRIPTRIDFWHSLPSLHVSVVINHSKPTNVKPIAELGGFTWIMPQFKIAGLQPIPIASSLSVSSSSSSPSSAYQSASATNALGGTPAFLADMQLPNVVPPQHFPSSAKGTGTQGSPPSYSFPLQIMHVYNEIYIAFVDYSKGCIVMYRYQHNNVNGSVVDMNAVMLRAAEKQQQQQIAAAAGSASNRNVEAQSSANFNATMGNNNGNASFSGGGGAVESMSTVASMRYYNKQQQTSAAMIASGGGGSPNSLVSSPAAVAGSPSSPSSSSLLPPSKLSAYALDPYKRAATVTHVAALVNEGQPMPMPLVKTSSLVSATSGGSSQNLAPDSAPQQANSQASSPLQQQQQRSRNASVAFNRGNGSFVDPNAADMTLFAGEVYLPLADAVANAVGALEKASGSSSGNNSSGNNASSSAGAGTGHGHSSNVPGTVQSAVFTGTNNGPSATMGDAGNSRMPNNYSFAPNGSLVHTFSNVYDGAGGGAGCCTWEVAFVLPLPAMSILSALRSEWYFGSDIAASHRWFTTPNPRDSIAAYRHSVAAQASTSKAASTLEAKKRSSNIHGDDARHQNSSAAAAGLPLSLQAPVILQSAADGLIYAHFPDCRAPHYTDTPRGACHLVTAYDLKLAVVEGSIAGMTACAETGMGLLGQAQVGQRSLFNANLYGDPQTVERATQSVADAYEAHVGCSVSQQNDGNNVNASLDGQGLPITVVSSGDRNNNDDAPSNRGTVILGPNSVNTSTAVTPQPSPSPRRGTHHNTTSGNGGASHSSIHGVSAFRALAGVSSYFTAAGSRDNIDEAVLSPEELLLLRKQQWVRHVTQMRVAELSERFVDVGDENDNRTALFASDVLWRELLQYLCARPSPGSVGRAGNPHPSVSSGAVGGAGSGGGGHPTPLDARGTMRGSVSTKSSSAARDSTSQTGGGGSSSSSTKGGWLRSFFGRNSDGKGAVHEETDAFPYAPIVHHLPIDVLTSPFEGSIRVTTGAAAPIVALEPPSHHQPFIASTVRHNALAITSRFDCYSEEVWGLMTMREQLAAMGGRLLGGGQSSPSRAASLVFGSKHHNNDNDNDPQNTAEYGDLSPATQPHRIGIQLRRPHFGPGGHYQRSLCFAAQFMLNRRAHVPRIGAHDVGGGIISSEGSAVGASFYSNEAMATTATTIPIIIDAVSIVKNVLLRSIGALESQAAIGRLLDVIIAHQCQHMEGAAWYRFWRSRWDGLSVFNDSSVNSTAQQGKSTGSGADLPLGSAVSRNGSLFAVPDGALDTVVAGGGGLSPLKAQQHLPTTDSSLTATASQQQPFSAAAANAFATTHKDIVARLPMLLKGPIDARVAEFTRFARTLAQPHLWPVNTTRLQPADAITVSANLIQQHAAITGGGEGILHPLAEIAIVPAALDANIMYEEVIVPLLAQLSALQSGGGVGSADTGSPNKPANAEFVSSQAAQAGYSFFKGYVLNTLFEYCRSTVQHGLPITVPIQSSLLDLLLSAAHTNQTNSASDSSSGGSDAINTPSSREMSPSFNAYSHHLTGESQSAYFRLHQLLMYRALEDHIPTAMQLIALQNAYPPAFQMGLDILGRLQAHSTIVQVFIARRMPMRAAKYLLFVRGLGAKSGAASPVGVGTLPSGEDLSNILAVLECTAALHDEEKKAVLEPHVPLRPVKSRAVLAREAAVAAGGCEESEGGELKEPSAAEEAQRHVAAVVSYLDNRLAKKKLKYAHQLTTSGALFCNVYTMLVLQWIESALRMQNNVGNSSPVGASRASMSLSAAEAGGTRGRYSVSAQAVGVTDPATVYPALRPYVERFERLKNGNTI